jgi:hypothetical protein
MRQTLADCKIPDDGLPNLSHGEAHPIGAWVRLKGVVIGAPDLLAGELTLSTRGKPQEHRYANAFRLQLENQQQLTLHSALCYAAPTFEHEGRWAELSSLPEAAPFHSRAPGPHVKATLSGWTLRPGQHIEALGRVVKVGLSSEGEEFRQAAKTILLEVEVKLLTHGDDAGKRLESIYHEAHALQRPRAPYSLRLKERATALYERVAAWMMANKAALGVLGWLAIAALHLSQWGTPDFFFGLVMLVIALYLYYQRAPLPPFFIAESYASNGYTRSSWVWWIGGISLVVALFFRLLGSTSHRTKSGGTIPPMDPSTLKIVVLCLLFPAVIFLIVEHLRFTASSWRIAWLMLRAPRATPGQWGHVEGAPLTQDKALLNRVERQRKNYDAVTDFYLSGEIQDQREAFAIQRQGDDVTTQITPQNALWSSTKFAISEWLRGAGKEPKTRTFQMSAHASQRFLLVGRANGDTLAATGPESLFIFAADEDPRGTLRKRFVSSWVVLLALVGVLVGSVVFLLT